MAYPRRHSRGPPGSRLTLAFEFQWDDVRDDQWKGGLLFRIPLGGGSSEPVQAPRAHQRRLMRMTERIVRDVDIVAGESKREGVVSARTGVAFQQVIVVDGNTADAEGTIEGAGDNSVVIADGQAGTITPADTIDMNTGQVLMGGGSSLAVRGANTGALATFRAPGTRGTLSISAGSGVDLINGASNTRILGVDLVGTAGEAHGIVLNNTTNVLIDHSTIITTGTGLDSSSGIQAFDSQVMVNHSTLTTSGGTSGVGISSGGTSQITVNHSTFTTSVGSGGSGDAGIWSADNSQVTVNHSTFTTRSLGILLFDNSQITVNGGSITTTGANANGVNAISRPTQTQAFLLNGVTINSTGNGVFLDGDALDAGTINATIRDSTITAAPALTRSSRSPMVRPRRT